MTPRLPDIGIRVSGGHDPRDGVALAVAAERAGFAAVWFAENPYQRGIMATMGACATATRRVRLGVGVINPYMRHPVQIAMDFAALDALAEGRAVLGIGSGVAAPIRRMGIANERPVTAVRETTAILRALLAGESVTTSGRVFSVEGARLGFTPHRFDPPIYIATTGERGFTACGEIADGFIVSNLTPLAIAAGQIGAVREAAARAGRLMPRVVQYVPCVARADGAAARRAVTAVVGELLRAFWPASGDWPAAKDAIVDESDIPRADFLAALERLHRGEAPADVLDERFVAAFAIAGTAAECLAQAAGYRVAGVDELALAFAGAQAADDIAYLGRAL
jgi:5,10-methylenetetrahydromethanopterin reductase